MPRQPGEAGACIVPGAQVHSGKRKRGQPEWTSKNPVITINVALDKQIDSWLALPDNNCISELSGNQFLRMDHV
jgi:hypothetical protein